MDGRLDHLHLMKGWDQGGGGKEMIDGSDVSIWLCFPSFSRHAPYKLIVFRQLSGPPSLIISNSTAVNDFFFSFNHILSNRAPWISGKMQKTWLEITRTEYLM